MFGKNLSDPRWVGRLVRWQLSERRKQAFHLMSWHNDPKGAGCYVTLLPNAVRPWHATDGAGDWLE
jgi:hypothetical protein